MKQLAGRLMLVTGAASGIGLETALALARRGARLVVSDVNADALERAGEAIRALGAECTTVACDVSDVDAVEAMAARVQERCGPLDVLVNNAGIAYLGGFLETPLERWRRIHEVNVMGTVHCVRAFLPSMLAAGGERKIVNVASTAGYAPAPNMSAYAASKHAVIGLSEVLALELHDAPVSVMIVCPGIINTPLIGTSGHAPGLAPAQLERLSRYYVEEGCHPSVVAEGIVRGIERDAILLPVGPMATIAHRMSRLSRRLARRLIVAGARRSGYLP
ncbi:MAG: SDR family NAD(P)-dependent oxidoreductase [Steroidobacteraceae bacterium]